MPGKPSTGSPLIIKKRKCPKSSIQPHTGHTIPFVAGQAITRFDLMRNRNKIILSICIKFPSNYGIRLYIKKKIPETASRKPVPD